ncbi:hypothetical protein PI93_019550 [Pandoraea fibrosis]|uniref:Uncharacterized protein n=1 Tax=Pandoraea fibrosis TaxID=1891094 RepID=A0ABX6HUN1_9BURK|nr:hypothetical protein [Pandoraea fibrosis]QHE91835.1 hypothetical protein PJ20_008450 [Pandoraea fibrosis]QHF14607.1 hypothetical protein PI93_019550 [Pandoraea fibrosis]
MLPVSNSGNAVIARVRSVSEPNRDTDKIKLDIDRLTQGKHVMVFSGYSGLGYKDPAKLHDQIQKELKRAIDIHGIARTCVAAGATSDGIGVVYDEAKRLSPDIVTIGVVSEQARGDDSLSSNCDHVIYVDDPEGTWKVLDENGRSYMAYLARNNESHSKTGEFLAFGGGAVTLSEVLEVRELNQNWSIFTDFDPDPIEAEKKKEKSPGVDLNPVRTDWLRRFSI